MENINPAYIDMLCTKFLKEGVVFLPFINNLIIDGEKIFIDVYITNMGVKGAILYKIEFKHLGGEMLYHTGKFVDFNSAIKDLFEKLDNFKFDRFKCIFYLEDDENAIDDWLDNKYIDNDNCCVCLEKTQSKTSCDHWLCLLCKDRIFQKLGPNNCPICRSKLNRCNCDNVYMFDDDDEDD